MRNGQLDNSEDQDENKLQMNLLVNTDNYNLNYNNVFNTHLVPGSYYFNIGSFTEALVLGVHVHNNIVIVASRKFTA